MHSKISLAFITLLSALALSKAQFSEKQLERLAFVRLNPCERAIWR